MQPQAEFHAGLDVGSTTLKLVIVEPAGGGIVFSEYRRHNTDILAGLRAVFAGARAVIGAGARIALTVTGSAGMGLAEAHGIPFLQEVIAAAEVVTRRNPGIRTLIDIGGEDAKMIFFAPGRAPDIRMNGSCAGGTGAFIDQVATLLGVEVAQLDALARDARTVHPIASRCGVFAKTDIQNLLARNVPPADIAASVFHAVALQIVTTLARGRDIMPRLLLCGGPLAFIPGLRAACLKQMNISESDCAVPENAALVPALGCAIARDQARLAGTIDELLARFSAARPGMAPMNGARLEKLFADPAAYAAWKTAKQRHALPRVALDALETDTCFLGIDSGSTTTKIVAIDARERVLFAFYEKNNGNPLAAARKGLARFHDEAAAAGHPALRIASAAVTGYGEDLIKAAFDFELGLVETIAHYLAARKLAPAVTFILDIGGQDMKAAFIENGAIVRLDINEACSSGCGSFIEGFANSLRHTAAEFSALACAADAPCDLGTRCTVFMNSKVKQSLREGSTLQDIAAGLAYSVVKNCLYKVLKLKNPGDLGAHIVVQGGTMRNHAVVRALERLTGREVLFADVPELMGAYGAALHALSAHHARRNNAANTDTAVRHSTLSIIKAPLDGETAEDITCPGCENRCSVRKYTFANANTFFSGNKCEKIFTNRGTTARKGENIYSFKYTQIFGRASTAPAPLNTAPAPTNAAAAPPNSPAPPNTAAPGAPTPHAPYTLHQAPSSERKTLTIGIPRALNYYENYPFWHALLTTAGARVVLSGRSTFNLYEKGAGTIMSDNICFPAKLVHGHIHDLIARKVDRILMPFVVYEQREDTRSVNTFNCPIVTGYSDVIRSAIDPEKKHGIALDAPGITFHDTRLLERACRGYIVDTLGLPARAFPRAFAAALAAQTAHARDLAEKARAIAATAAEKNRLLILLAGRPYHADPLIQHKVADMIAAFGAHIISEDIVRLDDDPAAADPGTVRQWAYTNRILKAARWVAGAPAHVHLVQLTSFGCGPDAFVIDETGDILRRAGKSHTILKIDDINNLGSLRLRIRSLVESLAYRAGQRGSGIPPLPIPREETNGKTPLPPPHTTGSPPIPHSTTPAFTAADRRRTILAPFFSETYSPFIPAILGLMGYRAINLPPANDTSIDYGLKYANNEVCYPATLVVGDIIRALNSGQYPARETAVGITQTGGQCRASNYIALIKKALVAAGHPDIPVISVATADGALSNDQPGFRLRWRGNIRPTIAAILYADRIAQMHNATAPRERAPGASARLRDDYAAAGAACVARRDLPALYQLLREAARDFNAAADPAQTRVPRIGIVGEIYVKYNSIGNKNIVEWLIAQGIEPVVPPLAGFFLQEFPNRRTNIAQNLARRTGLPFMDTLAYALVRHYLKKFDRIGSAFRHHHPFPDIYREAKTASRIINLAAQYGEGWLIPAELASFAHRGIHNAVSLQPFGCIANHLVAKGIEKRIRDLYPRMNLLFLDLDSGASEANLLNRLHFMIQNARVEATRSPAPELVEA
ncbi:MAG: acyl-CoA dehydratase activase-related protein [Opitutaceae bacterium]|jgi:predicted CoA-substrate-specific enzyme activase|nr:acyl-CoA dehydratase activase-related protein [Opitutaceae bacterium]